MVRTAARNRTVNRNEDATNREPAPTNQNVSANTTGDAATTATSAQERTSGHQPRTTQSAPDNPPSGGTSGTAVATQNDQRALGGVNARNAFESYGQQMSISSITGTLIKFNKGDWITGDDEDLEENTELVANMDQLMVGWIKWVDNRPAEQIMGPVAEGYQAQRRAELGDTDQADWEVDDQGRPRDPWQFSNYIVLKDPGQDAVEGNLYTFATSSKGGLGAIGALCREYGKEMRRRPDMYPIIRLGVDVYEHRTYGRIKTPTLTIIGWEPKAQFEATTEVSTVETNRPAEPEPAPARRASRRR